jgi:hypothetical protein
MPQRGTPSLSQNAPVPQDLAFSRPFRLAAQREGRISALLAYFEVAFSCRGAAPGEPIVLTTHPMAPATGWLQTIFSFPRALQVGGAGREGCSGRAQARGRRACPGPAGAGKQRGRLQLGHLSHAPAPIPS